MAKIKELTSEQKKKADKIVSLLDELRQDNVHPYVIDGGGGNGLSFIWHKKSDAYEIGNILLDVNHEQFDELDDAIYKPIKSSRNTIDYIVP